MKILTLCGVDDMKKRGMILIENLTSLMILMVIVGGLALNVGMFKKMYNNYMHTKFKLEFIDFVNRGKYSAVNDSSVYILRFYEKRMLLANNRNDVVDRFDFPKQIRMASFNGIYNSRLIIEDNGVITRGATFSYYFCDKLNKITISTITGKVNYA